MAAILRQEQREFREEPRKIDNFRLFSDFSRRKAGIDPKNLNFDLRRLDPGQYSAPYHYHRYAEELFVVMSGAATLRTPEGLEEVVTGDMIFFEMGETGAHQLYNHTQEACVYLDVRSYIGYDVCGYPDSDKILLAPSFEIFRADSIAGYFDGEENVREKWAEIEKRNI